MRRLILPLALCAVLSACDGDSMSGATTTTPAAATALDFTRFVLALLRSQSDTATPVAVQATQFAFADDDNPAAFAAAVAGGT